MMGLITISRREKEVLDLISHGYTTREIATRLYVSHHTVMSHRKKLLTKLGTPNVANLVRKSFELGLFEF